jgi:hypothetical protein
MRSISSWTAARRGRLTCSWLTNKVRRVANISCAYQLTTSDIAAFSTLTDLVFLILPILILWHANMDRRSKFSVGFVLCLAALYVFDQTTPIQSLLTTNSGCICSLIRFRYVEGLTQTTDFFWSAMNITIWSTVEAGACIIAGCLATLRPLMKCAVRQARESSAVSGAAQHISRSLRSTHRSNEHSKHGSLQRLDVALSQMDAKDYSNERKSSHPKFTTIPSYTESVARPDSAVTPLTSDIGNKKRNSGDPILKRIASDATDSTEESRNTRKPMRVSWTLHKKHTSEDVTSGQPTPTPLSPVRYKDASDAV